MLVLLLFTLNCVLALADHDGSGDPLDWLRSSIPGEPGEDYPILGSAKSTFSCESRLPGGYYADPDLGCQGYHVCLAGRRKMTKISFLCPNGTIFNQAKFICDWWYKVDCAQAESSYILNNEIGVVSIKTENEEKSLPVPSSKRGQNKKIVSTEQTAVDVNKNIRPRPSKKSEVTAKKKILDPTSENDISTPLPTTNDPSFVDKVENVKVVSKPSDTSEKIDRKSKPSTANKQPPTKSKPKETPTLDSPSKAPVSQPDKVVTQSVTSSSPVLFTTTEENFIPGKKGNKQPMKPTPRYQTNAQSIQTGIRLQKSKQPEVGPREENQVTNSESNQEQAAFRPASRPVPGIQTPSGSGDVLSQGASRGSKQKTKVPSNSYLPANLPFDPPAAVEKEGFKNSKIPNERKEFRFEDPVLFTLPPLPEAKIPIDLTDLTLSDSSLPSVGEEVEEPIIAQYDATIPETDTDSIGDTDTTLENLLQSFNLQLDIPKVKNP